jgi:hypothetical protein
MIATAPKAELNNSLSVLLITFIYYIRLNFFNSIKIPATALRNKDTFIILLKKFLDDHLKHIHNVNTIQ